jgi:hypothetical protein
MSSQPTAASSSAIALAPRLPSAAPSSVLSLVVVGLLGLVLLPLISLGCGPPT